MRGRGNRADAYRASLERWPQRLKLAGVAAGLLLGASLFLDYAGNVAARNEQAQLGRMCKDLKTECRAFHCSRVRKASGWNSDELLACTERCLDERFPNESVSCD